MLSYTFKGKSFPERSLQYARSKVDYVIGQFIYMLPSDMNLQIGKVKMVSLPSFKIVTNLKIILDGEKDKPDVNSNREGTIKIKPDIESDREHKRYIKKIRTKPNIDFKK